MYGGTGRMSWAEQKNSSYDKNSFGVTACSYLAVAMTEKYVVDSCDDDEDDHSWSSNAVVSHYRFSTDPVGSKQLNAATHPFCCSWACKYFGLPLSFC